MSPRTKPKPDATMTAQDVMRLAHFSQRTLRRAHTAGLKCIRPGVYRRQDVDTFLEAKKTADAHHREAQTELAAGLAAEAEGKLAQREAAYRDGRDVHIMWRLLRAMVLRRLEALPATLAARLPVESAPAIATTLHGEIRAFLTALSEAALEGAPTTSRAPRRAARRRGQTLEDRRADYARARGALARFRTKLAEGKLIRLDVMHAQFAGPVTATKARLSALPVALAPALERAARDGGQAAMVAILARAIADAAAEWPEHPPTKTTTRRKHP